MFIILLIGWFGFGLMSVLFIQAFLENLKIKKSLCKFDLMNKDLKFNKEKMEKELRDMNHAFRIAMTDRD